MKLTKPGDREIAMTREFDAPRHLVFDAWTKPELLKRWLGVFGGWSFEVCDVALKSPMEQGVVAGYDQLARLSPTLHHTQIT